MSIEGYTTNYRFGLIAYDSQNWHDDEHVNWNLLDILLSGVGDTIPFTRSYNSGADFHVDYTPALTAHTLGQQISFYVTVNMITSTNIYINALPVAALYTGANTPSVFSDVLAGSVIEAVCVQTTGTPRYVITRNTSVLRPTSIIIGSGSESKYTTNYAGARNIILDGPSGNVTGMTFVTGAAGVNSLIFDSGTFNGTYLAAVQIAGATGNMTIRAAGQYSGTTSWSELVISSTLFKFNKDISRTDSSAGSDFLITNNADNQITLNFSGGAANGLRINRAGSVDFLAPPKSPVYTVATLPTAASYQYCRVFVSDANATTFNSIVAGGGANKVPVFSDGTNWRIG